MSPLDVALHGSLKSNTRFYSFVPQTRPCVRPVPLSRATHSHGSAREGRSAVRVRHSCGAGGVASSEAPGDLRPVAESAHTDWGPSRTRGLRRPLGTACLSKQSIQRGDDMAGDAPACSSSSARRRRAASAPSPRVCLLLPLPPPASASRTRHPREPPAACRAWALRPGRERPHAAPRLAQGRQLLGKAADSGCVALGGLKGLYPCQPGHLLAAWPRAKASTSRASVSSLIRTSEACHQDWRCWPRTWHAVGGRRHDVLPLSVPSPQSLLQPDLPKVLTCPDAP